MLCTFYERVVGANTHFSVSKRAISCRGVFLCFMRRNSCAPPLGDPACHRPSNRSEHLLIHRIQSHTNPKRRKGFLKQAGQKSSKEELPKQRKGPKRAVEYRLKVPTHIWEQDAGSSSLPTRTKIRQNLVILADFLNFSGPVYLKKPKMGKGLMCGRTGA